MSIKAHFPTGHGIWDPERRLGLVGGENLDQLHKG